MVIKRINEDGVKWLKSNYDVLNEVEDYNKDVLILYKSTTQKNSVIVKRYFKELYRFATVLEITLKEPINIKYVV